MHVVAAPDKFKGTASAGAIAEAIAVAVEAAGSTCTRFPMADGGEGTLEALGGPNRSSLVTGPLGSPVEAEWRVDDDLAVIEMARSSGLVLAGGPEENDPMGATTAGVGELICNAIDAGASTIIIGVGGSATTDGGLGALDALGSAARVKGVKILVACDVRTRFTDAAMVFGAQKGASNAQITMLTGRLRALVGTYRDRFGVDVEQLDRAGAAGGLAGGLAAVGATLVDGFDVVAAELGLDDAIATADLVVTGEGFIDNESFDGKVVGGVAELAGIHQVPVLAIAGQVFDDAHQRIDAISLAEKYGLEQALANPTTCVTEAVAERF
ncbi:MAG: glycerate kinase [Acidimicrobiia bacterium]|nr:glycerate kinase [Acidimicrobiia bacterium]